MMQTNHPGNALIRKVTVADAAALRQISRQTFLEAFAATNTEEDMAKYLQDSFSIDKLSAELSTPGSSFYFAEADGNIIGYLKINSGQAQTELSEENGLEIERIYVLQDFQGVRIGQMLFEKAMEVARDRGAAYVWLGVWEENRRAISFYERNGFKAFGKHAFWLGSDEQTDILMRLPLMHGESRGA